MRVTAVESVELPVWERTIDSALRLERDGLVWYRHLEFQARKDAGLPRRCFEHNSRLILHYGAAVLTTVLYLLPGAERTASCSHGWISWALRVRPEGCAISPRRSSISEVADRHARRPETALAMTT